MTKPPKKLPFRWKFRRLRAIFTLVFFIGTKVCTSDEPAAGAAVSLKEAREARDAAERRAVQLELELERTKETLAKTRSRYADLYLRSHALLRSLRQTELSVANLWHNKDDASQNSLSARLLEALDAIGTSQLEAVRTLNAYETSLQTVLDVLKPSSALRRELSERLKTHRDTLERGLAPLSALPSANGNASLDRVRRGCRVLAADPELSILLLEGGSLQGMTPESRWHLTVDGRIAVRAVVIEVRPEFSAAVVTEGSLTDVPAGSMLLPDAGTR